MIYDDLGILGYNLREKECKLVGNRSEEKTNVRLGNKDWKNAKRATARNIVAKLGGDLIRKDNSKAHGEFIFPPGS
ncbi:hypothetical protein WH47_08945 [Habropoda laboriosa]|uniref:Uncharacterized protein n=1 Tax=Habropoda laboriosa TaxID=597456 RepID=A0A0L7R6N3_9HYME|nr:hypothetical protein WH47_08945 [Habropoda laboriosa]